MTKDFRLKSIEEFIGDTLAEAVKFPLYFRIAVKLVDAGFTEEDFAKGNFPTIAGGLLSDVRIAVRDIERKQVPKISAKSGQRLIDLARQL